LLDALKGIALNDVKAPLAQGAATRAKARAALHAAQVEQKWRRNHLFIAKKLEKGAPRKQTKCTRIWLRIGLSGLVQPVLFLFMFLHSYWGNMS
jgi:hypothetical protein